MTVDPPSTSMAFSVSGKTAIVTGAGSGINLSFAELLLSKNCNVVFADIALRPEAEDVVSCHQSQRGHGVQNSSASTARAVFVKTDVTSWPALENMFDVAYREFGDVDIVCPGAGVYEPYWSNFWCPPGSKLSRDSPDAGTYALLDINLTHPIRTTQLAISNWLHPRESQQAPFPRPAPASLSNPKRVIHIASVAAYIPVFRAPLYGASKFAIAGFVRSIAPLEQRYGIRVNAVAPGIVRTPLWSENPEKLANVDQAKDAWVTPEEVAVAMLSCVEDELMGGGLMLEVGAGCTREVSTFNDPGPNWSPEAGIITSNSASGNQEVYGFLESNAIWGRNGKQ